MNFLRIWFDKIVKLFRKLFHSELEPQIAEPKIPEPQIYAAESAQTAEPAPPSPAPAAFRIFGNAGIAHATVELSRTQSTVANAQGEYCFSGVLSGTYIIAPYSPVRGHTFLPEFQVVVVLDRDVQVDFLDPSSPIDCRVVTATTPNNSRNVQGSLIYDQPKAESRTAGAPLDCRVNKPVDSRVSSPQNSRT